MAERLRLDYRQVMNVIDDMKACEKKVEEAYELMTGDVNSLRDKGYMDGESAGAYINEFKEMLSPEMEALSELVGRYYKQLSEICSNFADCDAKLAQALS